MLDFIFSIIACSISSLIFIIFANKIPLKIFPNKQKKQEKLKITLLTLITLLHLFFFTKYKNFPEILKKYLSINLSELLILIIMNTCLFSYVICYQIFDDDCQDIKKKIKNIFTYRYFKSLILAPIYEEFYFRLIFRLFHIFLGNSKFPVFFGFFSALFFALSHSGENFKENLQIWTVTFVFGVYSNFVFFKTENLICVVFLHFYCNLMGPPQPTTKFMDKGQKQLLYFLLASGIVSFFVMTIFL